MYLLVGTRFYEFLTRKMKRAKEGRKEKRRILGKLGSQIRLKNILTNNFKGNVKASRICF